MGPQSGLATSLHLGVGGVGLNDQLFQMERTVHMTSIRLRRRSSGLVFLTVLVGTIGCGSKVETGKHRAGLSDDPPWTIDATVINEVQEAIAYTIEESAE